MKNKKSKLTNPTLSDKISAVLTTSPQPDVEDDHIFMTKPQIVTRNELTDSEDEIDISEFRRKNVKLLSEISDKYKGEVVSKRDLDLQTSESEETDEENEQQKGDSSNDSNQENFVSSSTDVQKLPSDDSESDDYDKQNTKSDDSVEETDSGKDSEGSDFEDDEEGYDLSQMEEAPKENFEHMTKQNISEEVKKGQCVRNELLIWESLLEIRIHMQLCINTANKMPFPDVQKDIKKRGGEEFTALSNKTKAGVSKLLDKFLTLQNLLLKNFPETKHISQSSKQKNKFEVIPKSEEKIPSDDEEIPSDTEDEGEIEDPELGTPEKVNELPKKRRKLSDYETDISKVHKAFTPFRNTTIQKWNEKTRLITATAQKNTPVNSILNQIDYILSDKNKLIRRTQLKRSEYDIIGYQKQSEEKDENGEAEINQTKGRKDGDEYIPEIFDDSDFYHQMLRELIECKSSDVSDPVQLSRQWIALQQMRSKMKRKVDTKATKGRRIKYVVHNQLVNFMAPDKSNLWSDETTNELYSSLFGKMFEANTGDFGQNGFTLNLENNI